MYVKPGQNKAYVFLMSPFEFVILRLIEVSLITRPRAPAGSFDLRLGLWFFHD